MKTTKQLSFDVREVNEITFNYTPKKGLPAVQITSPFEAYTFLNSIWNEYKYLKESFYVVLLNNAKYPIGYGLVSLGGLTATIVDPAEVLRFALSAPTASILLAHNHPSGGDKESRADVQLTKRITEAGKFLGIQVDDHIIITGEDEFVSFRAKGLIG